MVSKEDCEHKGKFYVEAYKRDDGTFVKSHCRKFRIGEEPEYLAWKKKQEKERNERMKELDENQDEGMELSAPEPLHDPAPENRSILDPPLEQEMESEISKGEWK